MKSEPDTYSIENLKMTKRRFWNGVRIIIKARNIMRDQIQVGDEILFYHSNSDPSGNCWTGYCLCSGRPRSASLTQNKNIMTIKPPRVSRWFCVEVQYKSILKTHPIK